MSLVSNFQLHQICQSRLRHVVIKSSSSEICVKGQNDPKTNVISLEFRPLKVKRSDGIQILKRVFKMVGL